MEGLNKVSDQWVPLQISVFSRWIQLQLNGKSNLKVEDITKDLSSGVVLCELATILTKKQPRRNWVHDPTRTVDMVQNCELAIRMFENDGVHFVGISGKDINDNKEKLILGLVWSLILHYSVVKSVENEREKGLLNNAQHTSVEKDEKEGPKALLNWAADRTANYPHVDNNNFKPYNLTMCALLDTYVPDKINYEKLDPKDSEKNTKLATDVMKDLGIPVLVYPEEIEKNHNQVDDKVLLTQLSSAKFVLDHSFHGIRKSGYLSDASQMSSEANQSEAGDRIALDTIKSEDTRAKNTGKYSGSNLIDLNSIPMNLNKQNGQENSYENSNLIDLNSIPVMQPGKRTNEQESILTSGQAGTANKDGAAVESSSEVETTSSEVDTYDESEEGENGKPTTFVSGFVDEQGHPIPTRVNEKGLVIGPDGKPIAGIVGYDEQGNPIFAKINENGAVVGKDGKPVAGIVGYDTQGNPIYSHVNENGVVVGPDGKPVGGIIGFDGEGHPIYSHVNENGVVVGPDGNPVSEITCFDAHGHPIYSKANESGVVVGPDGKPVAGIIGHDAQGNPIYAKINENGVVVGPDGKPVAGIVGYDAQGNPIYSQVNEHGIVVGPDGKPVGGIIGFDSEGHPIYSHVNENGVVVGPDGNLVTEIVTGYDAQGNPIYSRVNKDGVVVGPDGKPVGGINEHSMHPGVNGTAITHGKPMDGSKVNENGIVVGPDGKPVAGIVGYDAQGNPIYSQVNEHGIVVGPDGKPVGGIIGFDGEGHPIYSHVNENGVVVGPDGKPVTEAVTGFDSQGNPIYSKVNKDGVVVGPDGKPVAGIVGYDAQGHPIYPKINDKGVVIGSDGKPVAGIVGYDSHGNPIYSRVNENGVVVGPDGKPVAGIIGFDSEGHPIYSHVNKDGVIVGPDGKPVKETITGIDANGHPIFSKVNKNGVIVGQDGKPVAGIVGYDAQGNPIFSIVNENGEVVSPDGRPVAGLIGFDARGHPIYSTENEDGVIVGPDGKPVKEIITGFDANGHPIYSKVNEDGDIVGRVTDRNVALGQNEDGMKVLTLEDKYLTRKMSIRHVKLCKKGEKNVYNAALPWYISISGKRRHDEILRSQQFNCEDTCLTRRMSLPHFRFINEQPKPVEKVKSDDEAKEKAIENIEANSEDELLKEEARNAITQTPEDKVLTRKMSIRHIKLLKEGEKNYFEKNLKWYVSVSGKKRGSPEETKNVTRDFKIDPEDVVLTKHMSIPHLRTKRPVPKPAPKIDPETEARNKANAEYDAKQAANSIKFSPEDKVLTRKMSIRHIKLCQDGERNYFDNNLPWYVSISGKKRGSPEETKNATRDFELDPEDVVLTRKMSIPRYNDPKCTEEYQQEQKKLRAEAIAKQKAERLAAEEDEKRYIEENAHKGIHLTPEDKVLTRKMSIRHIKLCKNDEQNYYNRKLPWYVSISGKRRGSADECKADIRDTKFGPEDAVLTRHLSLPHFVPVGSDEPIEEFEEEDTLKVKSRDVNNENEDVEVTPEQKAKELNLEDKVLTRKLSIRHIRVLKPGEKNYKRPCLPWYVSTSGKWRGSHNERKAVTRDIEFDQEDKILTRKLNLPHYVRPKCDETGSNNNYTTCHMFDVKNKWW